MNEFLRNENRVFLQTYKRIPLDISHGEGVHLITKDGTRYLDFLSGLGVNVLGYAHPAIIEAIENQIERFSHISNFFITDVQLEFSEKLLNISGMSKVFLTNSGTEAVEAALKAVRKLKGCVKEVFSLSNSFHGRTYGALSITDKQKYKKDFKPLLPNASVIRFNDVTDLKNKINEHTAALFVEFIQGEGGINLLSEDFVSALISKRNEYNFLIIADCIQSGIGRTGKPFAFNHFDILPDMVLSAKSIGGGLPLGSLLVDKKYTDIFTYGSHGSTFGGNPVACAAGITVLKEVFENGLLVDVKRLGDYFLDQLSELKDMYPDIIREVRGSGLMIGVEMNQSCSSIVENLLVRKIISNCTNNNVLRLLPPYISTKTDIDFFLYNFHQVVKKL